MTIRAVFTGRQGVGKDTTIFGVAHKLKMLGYDVEVQNEIARDALWRGFKLSRQTDITSQLYILGKQLCVEAYHKKNSKADFILYNRSMLDCIAVSELVISPEEATVLGIAIHALIKLNPPDIIFQLQPFTDSVPDDKVRDTDPEFINKVQNAFMELAKDCENWGMRVEYITNVKGSTKAEDDIVTILTNM